MKRSEQTPPVWIVAALIPLISTGMLIASPWGVQADRANAAIELIPVVTLRDRNGFLPESAFSVIPTAAGDFVVAAKSRDRVLVFDKSGNLRTTLLPGPRATFAAVGTILPLPDGGLVIHDARAGELYPVTADLHVGAPTSMRNSPALALTKGEVVVAGQIRTPALAGFPIHLADRSGEILRSFGTDVPQLREDMRLVTNRLVGRSLGEDIWAVAPGRYVIEKWQPRLGKRLESLAVQSTWFRESVRLEDDERIRPKPIILTLWEASDCLWVLLRDADSDWVAPASANVERSFDIVEAAKTYDWILEAIDPKSGRVLGSLRSKDPIIGMSPSPYFVVNAKKSPVELVVLRPQLRRRSQ